MTHARSWWIRCVRLGSVLILLTLVSWPTPARPGIPMPPLAATERGAYRALDAKTAGVLWEVQWVLTRTEQGDRPILHLRENGAGVREFPGATAWTDRMVIDLWGLNPWISATRETRNGQHALEREQRVFDYTRGTGRVETQNLRTGNASAREVPLTAHTLPVELLSAVLRLLPTTPEQTMRFSLVMLTGRVVDMRARIVGREAVTIVPGTFDCFKVELEPTGWVGAVARLLMPKLLMWHTEVPPHFWVKFQGPDGGPGSREIVRELVSFAAN